MAAAKTKKKSTKKKIAKKRKSRTKKKNTVIEKMRENSLSLTVKDMLSVIGGVVALSLSVVAILGWKFVTNADFSTHKITAQQERIQVQQVQTQIEKRVDEKVFRLKFDDKELEKSIELLNKEDEHIKEKVQEVIVRQQNTDSKVERIDKNIVILLQQSRLEPAPAPYLKPLPNGREDSDDGK